MPVTFQEILDSRISTYIIGEVADGTATEFHVHDEAIAQLSTKLRDVVKGGCKVWKDVSKETFGRFVQFAYLGDYSVQGSVKAERKREVRMVEWGDEVPCEDEPVVFQGPIIEAVEEFWVPTSKKNKKKGKGQRQIEEESEEESERRRPTPEIPKPTSFCDLVYEPPAPRNNYAETCEPAFSFQADHTYAPVLLSHAALFHLGETWNIDSLKSLALYKLYKTLCIFKLDDDHVQDIVDLARYVNGKSGPGTGTGKGEEMKAVRELMVRFLVEHRGVLGKSEVFMGWVAEGGWLVRGLFGGLLVGG